MRLANMRYKLFDLFCRPCFRVSLVGVIGFLVLQGGSAPPEKPAKKRTASAAPSAVDRIPVLKVLQVLLPIIVAGLAYLIFFSGDSSK